MPKEEWGVKRACPSCSERFYDLRQDPMTCPACGATFTVDSLSESKPKALRPEREKPQAAAPVADIPDVDDPDTDIESNDDDLLDDDDDSVSLEEIADVGSDDDD